MQDITFEKLADKYVVPCLGYKKDNTGFSCTVVENGKIIERKKIKSYVYFCEKSNKRAGELLVTKNLPMLWVAMTTLDYEEMGLGKDQEVIKVSDLSSALLLDQSIEYKLSIRKRRRTCKGGGEHTSIFAIDYYEAMKKAIRDNNACLDNLASCCRDGFGGDQ